jgi:site-specific DNA recombinase
VKRTFTFELSNMLGTLGKGIERLLNAYQEALLSIEQLRERIPALRQREQTLRAELQAIADQADDQVAFLRLAETLTAFLGRLRSSAETLSVGERQRIVRLVVKDVLVGDDSITIRHSISLPTGPPQNTAPPPNQPDAQSYLLRKGSDYRALRSTYRHLRPLALLRNTRPQPFANQADDTGIAHAVLDKFDDPFLAHLVKEPANVRIEHPVHSPPMKANTQRIQRLMLVPTGPEPIRKATKIRLIYLIENGHHSLLNDFVFQRRDSQRALPPIGFRYVDPSRGLSPVRSTMHAAVQISQQTFQPRLILLPCHSVHSRRGVPLQCVKAVPQQIDRHMVKQGREPFLLSCLCCLTHTAQSL